MKWQKGTSGNPTGLAKERDIVSVEHWLKKAERELNSKRLTPVDRLTWQTKIIGLLLDRKDIPAKSKAAESKPKTNANTLEDLENGRAGTAGSGQVGVGDGAATV